MLSWKVQEIGARHIIARARALLISERGLISLWSLPTTQRCNKASAGNGDFNTSRICGQPSRGHL